MYVLELLTDIHRMLTEIRRDALHTQAELRRMSDATTAQGKKIDALTAAVDSIDTWIVAEKQRLADALAANPDDADVLANSARLDALTDRLTADLAPAAVSLSPAATEPTPGT